MLRLQDKIKIAYADPPYLGQGRKHYSKLHPRADEWDKLDKHKQLIEQLCDEFPDGWALSLSSPTLRDILPMCPIDVRVAAWVKPFCSFKKGVTVAYAWEPVIFRGGRKRTTQQETVRDWCSVSMTREKNHPGAKPFEFCIWLFQLMNLKDGDEFVDLFPGSGAVTKAWEQYRKSRQLWLRPSKRNTQSEYATIFT